MWVANSAYRNKTTQRMGDANYAYRNKSIKHRNKYGMQILPQPTPQTMMHTPEGGTNGRGTANGCMLPPNCCCCCCCCCCCWPAPADPPPNWPSKWGMPGMWGTPTTRKEMGTCWLGFITTKQNNKMHKEWDQEHSAHWACQWLTDRAGQILRNYRIWMAIHARN